jgi:UDP-glucose 4-epimerase
VVLTYQATITDPVVVTPDGRRKTHFVIVDAVGVCESDKTDSRPLERQRTVAFDKLLLGVALGKRDKFTIFGTDYPTPDGTCVRDYIHVLDLVEAHMLALQKLQSEKGAFVYNVGTGIGHSNKEVVEMVKKVSGKEIKLIEKERRPECGGCS